MTDLQQKPPSFPIAGRLDRSRANIEEDHGEPLLPQDIESTRRRVDPEFVFALLESSERIDIATTAGIVEALEL